MVKVQRIRDRRIPNPKLDIYIIPSLPKAQTSLTRWGRMMYELEANDAYIKAVFSRHSSTALHMNKEQWRQCAQDQCKLKSEISAWREVELGERESQFSLTVWPLVG